MFNKLSKSAANNLVRWGVVSGDSVDVCSYGIYILLNTVLNFLTTALIGVMFDMVLESIVLLISYLILRSYGGGYHADTPFRCYVISVAIIMCSLGCIKFFDITQYFYYLLLIVGVGVVFILAPVENINKPLDECEYKTYRKMSFIVIFTELIVLVVMHFIFQNIFKVIVIAIFIEGIMLILGKIKNSFEK